jgi:hypothetical protein
MLGNGPDPSNPPAFPNGMGCCAEACDFHLDALRCCNAGAPYVPATGQVVTEYTDITGFDPTNPSSDQGTSVPQLIAWRAQNPYPSGATLLGAPPVDATDPSKIAQGCWLAEGLSGCLCLPDDYESEEDAGDTWDVAGPANPENGHNVGIVDYDLSNKLVTLVTWGEPISMTMAAVAKYMVPSAGGALYAYCSSDCIAKMTGKAANGYDFSTLSSYLGLSSSERKVKDLVSRGRLAQAALRAKKIEFARRQRASMAAGAAATKPQPATPQPRR